MIVIPNKDFSVVANEDLAILCEVLFLDYQDNRLVPLFSDETREYLLEGLRESSLCPHLYDMVSIFGEEDFIRFVKPCIESLSQRFCDVDNYIKDFEEVFKELI